MSADAQMEVIAGIAASRGYAAGAVFVCRGDETAAVPEYEIAPERVLAELARYHSARAETRVQLEQLAASLEQRDAATAEIFRNHLVLVDDSTIVGSVEKFIRDGRLNVEAAIRRTVNEFRAVFGRMKDPYLRERIRDVDDVERRLLSVLLGRPVDGFSQISEPVIVVASDLTPSETVAIPRNKVLGFALDRGSATSHVSLLARSMGVPAVVGLGDVVARVKSGDVVLLNGVAGTVTVNPDIGTCAEFGRLVHRGRDILSDLDSGAENAVSVCLCANAQPGIPLDGLAAFGASGVGLYRSEYLWITCGREPTEKEQTADYVSAVRAAAAISGDARVVFRALDIGGDKFVQAERVNEPNPFLGCRSTRWLLSHRESFRVQLRSILRASAVGPAALLWPMIATVEELREANAELHVAMDELRQAGEPFDEHLPVGCMIEIPSAALCADRLAQEVDFFSIGTNDLVQYTLAADRGNERVSYLYQPTNPAVLRLVEMTVKAARSAGIHVAVCGETASDPVLGPLWVGLGVSELSMSASYIPTIRTVLRVLGEEKAAEMAKMALGMCSTSSAAEIYAACRDFIITRQPRLKELLATRAK